MAILHRAKIVTTSVSNIDKDVCLRTINHSDHCPFKGAQGTRFLVAYLRYPSTKDRSLILVIRAERRSKKECLRKFTDLGLAETDLRSLSHMLGDIQQSQIINATPSLP